MSLPSPCLLGGCTPRPCRARFSSTPCTRDSRAVITPAQRHEREAAASRRRVRTSLLLLAVSALAHLGHHAHHLLPLGADVHVPLFLAPLLPEGWFNWLQAGVATAALVGPGRVAGLFFYRVSLAGRRATMWLLSKTSFYLLTESVRLRWNRTKRRGAKLWDVADSFTNAPLPPYPCVVYSCKEMGSNTQRLFPAHSIALLHPPSGAAARSFDAWTATFQNVATPRLHCTLDHSQPLACLVPDRFFVQGASLIRSGLASLRRLSPDMNSLVSTGVLAVYCSSLVALLKPSSGLTATFHEPVCSSPLLSIQSCIFPAVIVLMGGRIRTLLHKVSRIVGLSLPSLCSCFSLLARLAVGEGDASRGRASREVPGNQAEAQGGRVSPGSLRRQT